MTHFQLLMDGERLLHGAVAKRVMKELNITILPGWPKYSPDINPQENVWSWAEGELRKRELQRDTFSTFQKKCLSAVNAYPSKAKLVGSMAKRCRLLAERKGKNIGK